MSLPATLRLPSFESHGSLGTPGSTQTLTDGERLLAVQDAVAACKRSEVIAMLGQLGLTPGECLNLLNNPPQASAMSPAPTVADTPSPLHVPLDLRATPSPVAFDPHGICKPEVQTPRRRAPPLTLTARMDRMAELLGKLEGMSDINMAEYHEMNEELDRLADPGKVGNATMDC